MNITKFGAFVNILPGRDGLVHISKLGGGKRINAVEDVLSLGQEIEVRVDEIDDKGKVSLVPVGDPPPKASRTAHPAAVPSARRPRPATSARASRSNDVEATATRVASSGAQRRRRRGQLRGQLRRRARRRTRRPRSEVGAPGRRTPAEAVATTVAVAAIADDDIRGQTRDESKSIGSDCDRIGQTERMRVGVNGAAGRMGRTVCAAVAADPDLVFVGRRRSRSGAGETVEGVGGRPNTCMRSPTRRATWWSTSPSPTRRATTFPWLGMHGIHAVVGTTGFTPSRSRPVRVDVRRGRAARTA